MPRKRCGAITCLRYFCAADGKTYEVEHYSLDAIISVGYCVKSQRGVEFRRWVTGALRRYLLQGHAENEDRLRRLDNRPEEKESMVSLVMNFLA